jgi:very-short-patch-repair endonuclease
MYCRHCPDCSKELCTKNKYYYNNAITKNSKCLSCSRKGIVFSEEHRSNLSKNHADVSGKNNPFWGKKHDDSTIEKLSLANKGMDRFTDEYKKVLSEKMKGSGNHFYGKSHSKKTKSKLSTPKSKEHRIKISNSLRGRKTNRKYIVSDETRRKMRISAVKRMKRTYGESKFLPSVNKNETEYFTKLEQQMGWDGIFFGKNGANVQYYIENLGYWVDFYDASRNIVVEYDESGHYHSDWTLRDKDVRRQNEIILELGCKFYRYNEVLDECRQYN